ncbi:putative autotransported protein [Salmonella enterica subsp. enterica serovar Hartford]|nr:putative autotransported protein [Salmonella enterica subsp. enterica serovar Hartford]
MSDATWNMTRSSTLTDLTLNSGATINFSHEDGEPWQTLTINEDYVGNGGKLVFNTVLNDDDSETDRLQVLGNTSGNTFVAVNNIGGAGRKPLKVLKLLTLLVILTVLSKKQAVLLPEPMTTTWCRKVKTGI